MGRILFFLVAVVAVIFAVLIFAPGIVPAATYKDRIEAAASNALGREVTIGDNLSFRIFPRTAFHVEDLTIANADGFKGDYLARVGEADIGVKLFKLITAGAVEVDRFVLTQPDISLTRKANGAVNWNLASSGAQTQSAGAGAGANSAGDIRLGDVRIVDGRARYSDETAGKTYAADDVDLAVVLTSLKEPLEVKGTMIFQGEPATVDLVLANLADVMANKPSNLKLDLKIGETTAGADLKIETKDALRYRGPVQLDAPDLPAFAALAGTELADAPGFDKLSVSGDVDGGDSALRLSDAKIGFDDIDAQGALTFDWSGAKPKASGVLSTEKLDLRPYMPPPTQSAQGFPEWSAEKMDFTGLRNIDADFDISTEAILLNDLKLGESRLKLKIENGRMTADIPELSMYGGQGSGQLVVNARGKTPSFSGNFDMGAVEAEPFSKDLLKNDNLLGLGSFQFDFTASGDNQAAIMSSMDGSGAFDLADGALKGVNIAGIVRAVSDLHSGVNPAALANLVTQARGPTQQTDYQEFLSNFTIADGLVNAPTIKLDGAHLTMTGKGVVNLPKQTIDLRLAPKATSKAFGEGGKALAVPLRIGGTFSQPTIAIDAEALLRAGAEGQLRDLLGGALGKEKGAEGDNATKDDTPLGAIQDILSKPKSDTPSDQQGAAEDQPSAEETLVNEGLNALFGRKKQPADEEEKPKEEEPKQ